MSESRPFRPAGSLAILAVAALIGAPAEAKPYYVLRAAGDARTIIDPAAVEPLPGGAVRRVPTVTVQRNIASSPPPQPGYVRSINEYDCAAQTMRWRSFSAYSRSGELLGGRKNPSPAWEPVKPATLGEWRVVCGLSGGDSAVDADSVAKLVVALMAAFDLPPVKAVELTSPSGAAKPAPKPTATKPKAKARPS